MSPQIPIKVLMVCLGNICRSPTAEGVLRHLVQQQGFQHLVQVDSAGTSDWHQGEPPDPRTIRAAKNRGFDLSSLRARQVVAQDFIEQHYILAMDGHNLLELERRCPPQQRDKLGLLLSHGSSPLRYVPDPYELAGPAFEEVLDLCEHACAALLQHLVTRHGLQPQRGRP